MAAFISVDVEADGPCPGLYSMISLGACTVNSKLTTFKVDLHPETDKWIPEALNSIGITREETLTYPPIRDGMLLFYDWLMTQSTPGERLILVSDNLAFDWQFVNYYFHKYLGSNPFGYSGRRIGDIYTGCVRAMRAPWKQFRKTKHTHKADDDAKGNAEALLYIMNRFDIK